MIAAEKQSSAQVARKSARHRNGQRRVELPVAGLLAIDGDARGIEHENARRCGQSYSADGAFPRPLAAAVDQRHVENRSACENSRSFFNVMEDAAERRVAGARQRREDHARLNPCQS